ncbi:ABC transporter ATP-binding protein [bacterium]|nr:MAG: ABC transporter ATP-binding protein [bacterium]
MRTPKGAAPLPFGPRGIQMGGEKQRARHRRETIGRVWSYLHRQRGRLIVVALLVVASTLLGLVGPFLMGRAIDGYILTHDLPGLARICFAMLAAYASSVVLSWIQSYLMVGIAQRAIFDIRNDLFQKLQHLPVRFFDQRSQGDLMSRLTNDVERLSSVLTDSVTQIVAGILSTLGILVAMLILSPTLTLVTVTSLVGASVLVNRYVGARIREGFRAQQKSLGELNGLIEESVSGQRVVKAFAQEATWLGRFDEANATLRESAIQAQTFSGFIGPSMNGINNFALTLVAGVGGVMVVRGLTTVGTVAAFINYGRQFGRPLNEIANLYNNIEAALAGAERVFETIDTEPEIDASDANQGFRICGDVVFENVTFAYEPGTPVLRDVSLHAHPGETVALIGPTGAGKTTIVNLLTRFYEIEGGHILIDGTDIREIPKQTLRQQIGIVLQDSYLFTGTVRENIRYGRLEATEEEIVAAAKMANADTFIRHLPHGYDTVLSERAGNLSQGQRQLLSIARTILADPQILILDEATSSVDTRTEIQIQEAMLRLMSDRTCFVIAHRLSTIRNADQILVLKGGEVIERGDHDHLVNAQGFYYGLLTGAEEDGVLAA